MTDDTPERKPELMYWPISNAEMDDLDARLDDICVTLAGVRTVAEAETMAADAADELADAAAIDAAYPWVFAQQDPVGAWLTLNERIARVMDLLAADDTYTAAIEAVEPRRRQRWQASREVFIPIGEARIEALRRELLDLDHMTWDEARDALLAREKQG
ncbi:MAG: hypothetical protein F4098_07160 [Acidimicrobiaceae bacterium]|nr:hypothetical protein [Acidimicrobiaceae bacterium]